MSIAEAFAAIADKNSEQRWLVTEFDNKTGKLVLVKASSEGFEEFEKLLTDDKILFCVYKVYGIDEREACVSKRDKLVAITWLGQSVSPLRRNAPLQSKQERDQLFTGIVTEIQADEKRFMTPEAITQKLIAVGGAHKPNKYDFGGKEVDANFYESGK